MPAPVTAGARFFGLKAAAPAPVGRRPNLLPKAVPWPFPVVHDRRVAILHVDSMCHTYPPSVQCFAASRWIVATPTPSSLEMVTHDRRS